MSLKYSFRTLGMDSGGHLSLVALDPTGQKLMAGGDIQGFFFSDNFGDSWRVRNRGLWVDNWHRVASVLWSRTDPNTVYAAVGDLGTSGGFMVSTNNGDSWVRRSAVPTFAGNHTSAPLPSGHPRSTGNLLAQASNGRLYAGTYDGGVFVSDDEGVNWSNIGFSGGSHYIRSIALDPNDESALYVALYGERIWKTTDATAASPTWSQLTGAPLNPEELKIIGTYVYAVCNTDGVYRSTDGGTNWESLNEGYLDTTTSKWMSIDGYESGSNHVVIVGCAQPVEPVSGQGYRSLVRLSVTASSTVTYTELGRNPSNVSFTIAPNDRAWWRGGGSYADWPSGRFNNPSSILIDPNNTDHIWVSGSSGVFRSSDGGTTWKMACNGMPLTTNRRVAVDPLHPLRVLVGNTDWTLLEVDDGYGRNGSVSRAWAPSSAGSSYDVAVDPTDGTAFIGVGDRDNNDEGAIFSLPFGATSWTNEGLEATDILTREVTDTFTRTATDGWGTADSGQVWTVVSGPAANLSADGTTGRMQLAASSASRSIFLQTTSILDCTGTFDVSWSAAAAGTGGHFAAFHVRTDGTTASSYAFRIDESATTNQATIRVHRIVSTATQIGTDGTVAGYTPTSTIHVRFRVSGTNPTTLNLKAWVGSTEPDGWMITITDSEATLQNAGPIALRAGGGTGYTAAATAIFDNLEVDTIATAAVTSENKRPIGIAVGRDGSNNRILLAAVQESGLWRKTGGTWTRVNTTICSAAQVSRAAWFAWQEGSQYVYVFDRASGVYRSGDYGSTWTLIWNVTSDVGRTGFIALNPAVANELWVSTESALYRLSNAQSGTVGGGITAASISGVEQPGCIAFDAEGTLFCASLPDSTNPPRLLRSANNGASWQDVSDESFKAAANRLSDIKVSPTGRIYASSIANGILVGHSVGQQQIS